MTKISIIIVFFLSVVLTKNSVAEECPSTTTLKFNSTDYSGKINVELRRGNRPGSQIVEKRTINSNGTAIFNNVCKGNYFFSFGTLDSEQVNVTRYFEVKHEGRSYSNPQISVFYSRNSSDGSQRVSSVKKNSL